MTLQKCKQVAVSLTCVTTSYIH